MHVVLVTVTELPSAGMKSCVWHSVSVGSVPTQHLFSSPGASISSPSISGDCCSNSSRSCVPCPVHIPVHEIVPAPRSSYPAQVPIVGLGGPQFGPSASFVIGSIVPVQHTCVGSTSVVPS